MFDALIFRPIFNVLSGIYALLPGHDFGLAIIIFTIVTRFAMWPLLKKQLHQSRVMRKIQPEIKELKKKYAGDRRQESVALMELYKRYGVNPFSSLGLLVIQIPVFLALFSALRSIITDPHVLVERSYFFIEKLPHMQSIADKTANFDPSFLGLVNMTDYAYKGGELVVGAMIIALLAGVFQFLQSKQLAPERKKTKSIREMMRDSKDGKEPDMTELNAATARRMTMLMPALITLVAASSPAGLATYFAAGGIVGYLQQRTVFKHDVQEMEEMKITTKVRTGVSATKKKGSSRNKGR